MSNGSFANELANMAIAAQRVPTLETQVAELEGTLKHTSQWNDNLLQENAALKARISSLEVERDDASFRELEAIDRADNAERAMRTVQATVGEALAVLVKPVPTTAPIASEPSSHSAPSEGASGQMGIGGHGGEGASPLPASTPPEQGEQSPLPMSLQASSPPRDDQGRFASLLAPSQPHSQPVVAPDLSASPSLSVELYKDATQEGREQVGEQSQPSFGNGMEPTGHGSSSTEGVSVPPSPTQSSGPYADKKYYEYPAFVELDTWLAGGGTEHNYHWRPWHNDDNGELPRVNQVYSS